MNRKAFYAAQSATLTQLRQQFPQGFCHLTSLDTARRVVEVGLENAARCLTEGTHQIASPEQIFAYQSQMEMAATKSRRVDSLAAARRLYAAITDGGKGKAL